MNRNIKLNRSKAHLVFKPTAAGKSTYARKPAKEVNGVRFAVDERMHAMFGADMPTRRQRALDRNAEKEETYSFDVTPGMFEAMESYFERPTDTKLSSPQLVRVPR